MQKDKGLPHFLFFYYLGGDFFGLALADALDLRQPLRLLFHDPEGIFPEFLYNLCCQGFPNPFDCPRSQIPANTFLIVRDHYPGAFHLKLASIDRMLHKTALQFQCFPGFHRPEISHTDDLFPLCRQ